MVLVPVVMHRIVKVTGLLRMHACHRRRHWELADAARGASRSSLQRAQLL